MDYKTMTFEELAVAKREAEQKARIAEDMKRRERVLAMMRAEDEDNEDF